MNRRDRRVRVLVLESVETNGVAVLAQLFKNARRIPFARPHEEERRVCAVLVEERNRPFPVGEVAVIERKDESAALCRVATIAEPQLHKPIPVRATPQAASSPRQST